MVGPGERIIVDGKTYKNVARAWLNPFKAGPDQFSLPAGRSSREAWHDRRQRHR